MKPKDIIIYLHRYIIIGKRYRIVFNADKTKLVVTGSQIDMDYYREVSPWTLNGEQISVTEDNEHLSRVVSGRDEDEKNIDSNILYLG